MLPFRIVSEGLTLSEYADALIAWHEFQTNARGPRGPIVSDLDIEAWEIDTDSLLIEEV